MHKNKGTGRYWDEGIIESSWFESNQMSRFGRGRSVCAESMLAADRRGEKTNKQTLGI